MATEPVVEGTAPRRPAGSRRASRSTFTASARGGSAGAGSSATRRRSRSGRCSCCSCSPAWRRRSGPTRWPTRAQREPPVGHDRRRRQEDERRGARRRADRPAVAEGRRQVSPGRRLQRPRHHGSPALRRPQLAADRDRAAAHDHGAVDHPGADRRLLPRPVGRRHQIRARRDVVVPRRDPRRRARRGAGTRRAQPRADNDIGRLARHPHLHHRHRLRALHGAADPRAGAVASREGVRRGGARAGRRAAPDHVHGDRCRTCPRRCSCSSR